MEQMPCNAHGASPRSVPQLGGLGQGAALPSKAEDAVSPLQAVSVLLGGMGGTCWAGTGLSCAVFLSCAFEPSGLISKKAFPPAVVTYKSLLGEGWCSFITRCAAAMGCGGTLY